MSFLSKRERKALASICDTLIPALPTRADAPHISQYQASDAQLVERLERMYENVASDEERQNLKFMLNAFEVGLFNGILGGTWRRFSQMSLQERETVLKNWATSRFEVQRKAFQGIKRLALFLAYSNLPQLERHPIWDEIQYSGPPVAPAHIGKTIEPHRIVDNRTLSCDVLIIGSGAGGGVVAGELSAAGYDVIVAEKGDYHAEPDFKGNEREASERLFEKQGALTTKDTAMIVLAASTLGGGTTVNWSASLRTPQHVLREWANTYGIREAVTAIWQQSLDAVTGRINVNCDESFLNVNNRQFEVGCQKLGYHLETIPRNVKGCEECGFCNYGCPFGAKQSTLKTYLQDAYKRGTRIIVRANVRRVMHQRGRVTGAVMAATDENAALHLLTVKAKAVVVCAGTIHTPAILRRSGLDNPNIGANLHLHPTTVIFSRFGEPVQPWVGVPLSRISKEFADLDGNGYGDALEVAPAHPGLMAATLPWMGAQSHKTLVNQIAHLANVIAITRDYYGGRVDVNKYGEPVLDYQLHEYDKQHLLRGVQEALKVHYAAGAEEVFAPHNMQLRFKNNGNDSDFVRFLRRVEDAGLEANAFPLFSAHQMSSCRMAANRKQGALKPTGELWDVRHLFIADGSAMPTATGVNPMLSIMATAHYIAQHIKQALQNA